MFNPTNQLIIDLKTQDRLREWFSKRNSDAPLKLTNLMLGDSDVHYAMSFKKNQLQVISAPYNVQRIKHPLIYEGTSQNLSGDIKLFARFLTELDDITSLYAYPPTLTYLSGNLPPSLGNGYDHNLLLFSVGSGKQAYVCFLQTLPDNYSAVNSNGQTVQGRLVEGYSYVVDCPFVSYGIAGGIETLTLFNSNSWEMIIDHNKHSFLLAHNDQQLFVDANNGSFEGLVGGFNLQTIININLDPTTIGTTITTPYSGTQSGRFQLPPIADDGSELFLKSISTYNYVAGTTYFFSAWIRLPLNMWTSGSADIWIGPFSMTNFTEVSSTRWINNSSPTATWFLIESQILCDVNTTIETSILGSQYQFLRNAGIIEIDSIRIATYPIVLGNNTITITGLQSGLIKEITF